jgi:hypothetical protein
VLRSGEIAAALGFAFVLALVGCSFPADYSGTRYRCDPGDECPAGFSCVDGFCREESDGGPDAGEGGDAGAASDHPVGEAAGDSRASEMAPVGASAHTMRRFGHRRTECAPRSASPRAGQ